VSKPNAVIAIWTYHRHTTGDDKIDQAVRDFYEHITKPYWDYERKYVEEKYTTVEFDYELLPVKDFETVLQWQREDLIGYISSWSAVQKFIKVNSYSPVLIVEEKIKKLWASGEAKKVVFPIYLKLGRIIK
jgi:hypothetical protein